jgi:hypothetical protein
MAEALRREASEPKGRRRTIMRRVPWLMAVLVVAALAAGCGSSSSSSSTATTGTTTSPSTASTPGPGATSTGTGEGTSTTKTAGANAASGAVAKLLVNACKRRIQNEPALTTSEKVELEPLCDKSAGGVAAAHQAGEEVCVEVIKHSASPGSASTPARKQALAACKSAK